MRILLTGTTGYIGKRLLSVLLENGHEVYCCVRDLGRIEKNTDAELVHYLEIDFLKTNSLNDSLPEIDIAYYLIHSMSCSTQNFEAMEQLAATNFKHLVETLHVKQVIYLSGIVNEQELSKHLKSRRAVEEILQSKEYATTTLRAGIIVGSGSASFEIIRDLVEKLPVMIAPRWLKTRSQPIAIRNVLQFLYKVMNDSYCFNKSFDIGGPDILNYKQMLLQFGEVRGLKRRVFIVPVMTPKLSSYWLYFVTSTSYKLAVNLVDSMKVEVVCRPNDLVNRFGIELLSYKEAVSKAFERTKNHMVFSSWTDAQSTNILAPGISSLAEVPTFGCYIDQRECEISDQKQVLENIWSIGGEHGWYAAQSLWKFRGFLDKIVGGVGFRRGRTHPSEISAGDALDFWRVLYANKEQKRLLLYAEMKLPGEAWLEFRIVENRIVQTATFRPLGLLGRMYWYSVLPFHHFIFEKMMRKIANRE